MDGSPEALLGLSPREGKYTVARHPRIGVGIKPLAVGDKVTFGVMPDGDVHTRILVEAETEAGNGRELSVDSPLGRALLGALVEDVVDVEVDGHVIQVKVLF